MTGRFLFIAAIYQGLFYLADLRSNPSHSFFKACGRLLCGVVCLLLCFLISTGLIAPSQIKLCYLQLFYGGMTLYLHFLGREQLMLYDFLILTYGLSFFMLPKISPLDFIHAFMGSSVLTLLYIYVSAFWLDLQQWCLSSIFLLFVAMLFMYISYSAERSSRERWLLRERLSQEHIDLRIVMSTIEEDMAAAASRQQRMQGSGGGQGDIEGEGAAAAANTTSSSFSVSSGASSSVDFMRPHTRRRRISRRRATGQQQSYLQSGGRSSQSDHRMFGAAESGGEEEGLGRGEPSKKQRMHMFFKGLVAWALCMAMGYAFQIIADADGGSGGSEAMRAPSKAFALLMHSMGFSVFLLYFTGQMRWLVVNGFVGVVLLLIFNESGIDNRWAVISTHSVGYFILAVVVVASILVFGGVVLVWSHLIEFVKNIISRYPEVTDHIRRDNKVLENVLLSYLAEIPSLSPLRRDYPARGAGGSEEEAEEEHGADGTRGAMKTGCGDSSHRQQSLHGDEESGLGRAPVFSSGAALGLEGRGESHAVLTKRQRDGGPRGSDSTSSPPPYSQQLGSDMTRGYGYVRHSSSANDVTQQPPWSLPKRLTPLLESKRGPNTCYFCLRDGVSCMLPACAGWMPRDEAAKGIQVCTPYTELVHRREELTQKLEVTENELSLANHRISQLMEALRTAEATVEEAQCEARQSQEALAVARADAERELRSRAAAHEEAVQRLISGFNGQVTQMKRLYKALRRGSGSNGSAHRATPSTYETAAEGMEVAGAASPPMDPAGGAGRVVAAARVGKKGGDPEQTAATAARVTGDGRESYEPALISPINKEGDALSHSVSAIIKSVSTTGGQYPKEGASLPPFPAGPLSGLYTYEYGAAAEPPEGRGDNDGDMELDFDRYVCYNVWFSKCVLYSVLV
jgi:hypothetical protein